MGTGTNLKTFINEKFNDLSNCLSGTYWNIEQQRLNAVQYHAYSLLVEKALNEGSPTLAGILQDKRDANFDAPKVDDPNYKGSRREKADLFDAQHEAKRLADFVAKKPDTNTHHTHDQWMQEDHLPLLYELSNEQEKSPEPQYSILGL